MTISSTVLSAQGTRADTTVLPTVSVTATRGAASILTAPLAVTKLTGAALRNVNGYGLDEALSKVPGVLAQSRYGTSDVRIVIRGFGARGAGDRSNAGTSRGIRVLIDGIPETEPDGRTSFDQIDLSTASAVEVIRSNASSIWGNGAGGVIHVMTPTWSSTPVAEIQPIFGSFGTQRYALRSSSPLGDRGTAYLNMSNTTFEGWRAHSDSRRQLFNAGAVGFVGNTKIGFYASGANHMFRIPGPLTKAQADSAPEQANAGYASRDERRYNRIARLGATAEHDFANSIGVSGMVFVSPKYLQRSERNTFRDFTRYHLGGSLTAHKDMQWSPTLDSRITVGFDEQYQDGAILFYNLVNGQRGDTVRDNKAEGANNKGFFIQDELQFGKKLAVTIGARYDNVSYYNKSFINAALTGSKSFDQVSPKLGASYRIGGTSALYANFGRGIEVPAGNEVDPFAAQGVVAINPLLDAITSSTLEAGYKTIGAALGPLTLSSDIAVYNTNVTNDLQPYNAGRFYMSAGETRRTGVEVGANAETKAGIFSNLALTVSSNKYLEYSVDSSKFIANGGTGVFDDNKQAGVPDVMAEFELGTSLPGLRSVRVKAGVEHIGEYFTDDANREDAKVAAYTIFNLTAELSKPIAMRNGLGLRAFFTVHNVTDKAYIGSAFLNPDRVGGVPVAFEPGMPRAFTLSFSVGKMQ